MAPKWRATIAIAGCFAAACRAEPRAAICFYGLTRSLTYTIDTIRSNIFDPIIEDGISYSVFLHTYSVAEINNPTTAENHLAVDWRAFRRLQPTAFEVEDADDVFAREFMERFDSLRHYGDAWDVPNNIYQKNLLLQLHSLKKVAGLHEEAARQDGPFDVVIALRSDLWIFNWIDIEHVRAAMQFNNTVYMPASDTRGGLNDLLAFGHPDAMQRVMHRLDDTLWYSEQQPLNSESFLKYTMETNGLTAAETDIVLERVRGNGFLHQIPEFHTRGGLASWKPGKWMRKNRLAMWELSAIPADTDIVVERVGGNGLLPQQIPESSSHTRSGFASWKPGRWMRRNRLAMWELSAIPPGYVQLDDVLKKVVGQSQN